MPKHVLTDARVEINGVNLSTFARSVTISTPRDQVETTAMGQTAKSYAPGLKDATVEVEYYQGYGAAEVDAVHDPLSSSTTPFTVKIRATTGAITTTNPEWQMSALLYDYSPMAGSVGDANTTTVSYANAGSGITRATS